MSMFENFRIKTLCMHEVFKRVASDKELPPNFGKQVVSLDAAAQQHLSERLVAALGDQSAGVLMVIKDGPDQGVFPVVLKCFEHTDDAGLLTDSKVLAAKLSSLQTRTNIPGGVVLVIKGTTSAANRPFISIIKAEVHSGFTKLEADGTLGLKFAKDLFLTPDQRFFKIGIYIKKHPADFPATSPETHQYEVMVFDNQMSKINLVGAAVYFSSSFLGCERPKNNNVYTQMFYESTKSYIYRSDMTEPQKMDASVALYSYLKLKKSETFKSSEFADDYLPPRLKDEYESFMKKAGLPDRAIHKDLSLLKGSFERKRILFKSGLRVVGSPTAFGKNVHVGKKDENGRHVVTITDEIDGQS